MLLVNRSCGCYPNYISELKHLLPEIIKNSRPCNYIEHAVCVSGIVGQWEWSDYKCKPACSSYSFHQESIQYADMFNDLPNSKMSF